MSIFMPSGRASWLAERRSTMRSTIRAIMIVTRRSCRRRFRPSCVSARTPSPFRARRPAPRRDGARCGSLPRRTLPPCAPSASAGVPSPAAAFRAARASSCVRRSPWRRRRPAWPRLLRRGNAVRDVCACLHSLLCCAVAAAPPAHDGCDEKYRRQDEEAEHEEERQEGDGERDRREHEKYARHETAAEPVDAVAEIVMEAFADVGLEGAAARAHVFAEGVALGPPFGLALAPLVALPAPFFARRVDGFLSFGGWRWCFVDREFVAHADIQFAHVEPP